VKRLVIVVLLLALAVPAFAGTHQDVFNVPCRALWPAVSDTLKNSGKYWVQNIDNAAMSASYNVGGGPAKRTISVVLIAQGNSCELQTQAGAAPPGHHDAADFKDRVTLSLAPERAGQCARQTVTRELGKTAYRSRVDERRCCQAQRGRT
jgi:hypothetical protein